MLVSMGRKRSQWTSLAGMQINPASVGNIMNVTQRPENRTTVIIQLDPSCIRVRRKQSSHTKETCILKVIVKLSTMTKLPNRSRNLLRNKWIKKTKYVYTMQYCSATRKSEILSFEWKMDRSRCHNVRIKTNITWQVSYGHLQGE